jgi:hypothetical protein
MLNAYLMRAGVTTGPLRKNTSHSALDRLKRFLFGLPQLKQLKGTEGFLNFGNALHEAFLLNKYGESYSRLTAEDQKTINLMVVKLRRHPVVSALVADSEREIKKTTTIEGVEFTYILDAKQKEKKRGSDLKSTSARTIQEFIQQAKDLGYFRQSKSYKIAEGLDEFFYFAQQKKKPHDIFIIDCAKFKEEEAYYEAELKFLLYFTKNYGFITNEYLYGTKNR